MSWVRWCLSVVAITMSSQSIAAVKEYVYDNGDRLSSVTSNNTKTKYQFDSAGNRLSYWHQNSTHSSSYNQLSLQFSTDEISTAKGKLSWGLDGKDSEQLWSYKVVIYDIKTGQKTVLVDGITEDELSLPSLGAAADYQVEVIATNANGEQVSFIKEFSTNNIAPTAPVINKKYPDYNFLEKHFSFLWEPSTDIDPFDNQLTYWLEISDDENGPFKKLKETTKTTANFPAKDLPKSTNIWWRVTASDEHGGRSSSQAYRFQNLDGSLLNFENEEFAGFKWRHTTPIHWARNQEKAQSGQWSLRAGNIGHSQKTTIATEFYTAGGVLSLQYALSSEGCHDHLKLLLNGNEVIKGCNTDGVFKYAEHLLEAGAYTLEIQYQKDGGANNGEDTAWIDQLYIPGLADTDEDGISDGWEMKHFNSLDVMYAGSTEDADQDGLTDIQEMALNSDPNNADTDQDGLNDGYEHTHGLNVHVNDANEDADGDGISNLNEMHLNTDPNDATSKHGSTIEFEDETFAGFKWRHTTPIRWARDQEKAQSGQWSLRAGDIGHSQKTTIATEFYTAGGALSLQYALSSEGCHDHLKLLLNGNEVIKGCNTDGVFKYAEHPLEAGAYTLEIQYQKDGSSNNGEDTAWIDQLYIPGIAGIDSAGTVISSEKYESLDDFIGTLTPIRHYKLSERVDHQILDLSNHMEATILTRDETIDVDSLELSTPESGVSSQYITLNQDAYISMGRLESSQIVNGFTWSAWIKVNEQHRWQNFFNANNGYKDVDGKFDGKRGIDTIYLAQWADKNEYCASVREGETTKLFTKKIGTISEEYQFISLVYENGVYQFYVDGELSSEISGVKPTSVAREFFSMGQSMDGKQLFRSDFQVGRIAIFDRALTARSIEAMYQLSQPSEE